VSEITTLIEQTSPTRVLNDALHTIESIDPDAYHPADIFTAIIEASNNNVLTLQRAYRLLRTSVPGESRRVTHKTHEQAVGFLRNALLYSMLHPNGADNQDDASA
jgi:hypothetical protein